MWFNSWFFPCGTLISLVYVTGAQKWHIVSLLGDVTSPTTVAHYVSMTCSDNREALTSAPTAHSDGNKRLEFTTEQVERLRYATAVDGGLKRFPSVAWFAQPWYMLINPERSGPWGRKFDDCQAVIAKFTDRVIHTSAAEVVMCPTSFCIPEVGRWIGHVYVLF